MKKVLFATTALVATAGVAAADVSFGGYGRFGILYTEGAAQETTIESRLRLNIDATAESDNGLAFNARFRIQADDSGTVANTGSINGALFGVTAGGLNVQVGNISGAIDSQAGMYNHTVGLSGLGYHNVIANSGTSFATGYWAFDTYSSTGAGRNGVRVSYGMGNFNVIASYSDMRPTGGTERSAITASFDVNDWTVSVGYQESSLDSEDKLTGIVAGSLGVADVTLGVADNDGDLKYLVGADFQVGAATTITLFVTDDDDVAATDTAYGVGVNHDMGGGTSIRGGFVSQPNGMNVADLGLQFGF
ncbi:porin [Aquicoccus sp. SCR17]|nr:porin [Carideicomes alvinocaridis]